MPPTFKKKILSRQCRLLESQPRPTDSYQTVDVAHQREQRVDDWVVFTRNNFFQIDPYLQDRLG